MEKRAGESAELLWARSSEEASGRGQSKHLSENKRLTKPGTKQQKHKQRGESKTTTKRKGRDRMRGRADRKMLDEWVVEGRGGEVRGPFSFGPFLINLKGPRLNCLSPRATIEKKRPSESPSFSPLLHHSGLLTWSVRRNSAWILSVQRPNVDVMRVASVLRGRHVRGLTFVWAKRNSKQRGWDGPSAGLPAGCLVGSTGLQSAIYRATCISSCLLFIFLVSRTAEGTGRACFAQLADSRKRSFPPLGQAVLVSFDALSLPPPSLSTKEVPHLSFLFLGFPLSL